MATTALLFAVLAAAPTERVLAIVTPSGDINERQAGLYEAHLRLELAKHQGLEVVRQIQREATPEDKQCVERPDCLANLAKGVGAELVVFARAARLGGDSIVTMKRLRILTGEIEQTTTRSLEGGNGQEMLVVLGAMVTELFPERPIISGAMTGVTRDDVVRWSPPPVKPWMFWTGVGATAASGACVLIFALKKHEAENEWNDTVNAGTPGGVSGNQLLDISNRANDWKNRTNVAIGATAGLAVGTAILGYFTDWHKSRDTELLVGPTGGSFKTTF